MTLYFIKGPFVCMGIEYIRIQGQMGSHKGLLEVKAEGYKVEM